jgi:Immunoglobulin I-set domain
VSASYVNFINEDREIYCVGENVAWYRNNQPLPTTSSKYLIEEIRSIRNEAQSKLTIKKIDTNDNGNFTCVPRTSKPQVFELKTFCEHFNLK